MRLPIFSIATAVKSASFDLRHKFGFMLGYSLAGARECRAGVALRVKSRVSARPDPADFV
jgi:hypothetical protein